MRYVVILNPAAGKGRAGLRREALEAAFRESGLNVELCLSERPGHGTELAREAAQRVDVVVAVGGDGTIQEVCRGLVESRREVHLGIVPLGTGNDFIKALGIPEGMRAAIHVLATSQPRPVDYGYVQWGSDRAEQGRLFVNVVGVGFDAYVAAVAEQYRHWPGKSRYALALMRVLRHWKSPLVRISTRAGVDGAHSPLFEGLLLMVTVGNGVSSGGMFRLTPRALIDDGLLDVCAVERTSMRRILQNLPLVLRGRHEMAREVHSYRVGSLEIEADRGVPVHADGEILAQNARYVAIETIPGGLSVFAPR